MLKGARVLHQQMRMILQRDHKARSRLAIIREASGLVVNAHLASRIGIRAEAMHDRPEMIGSEIIGPQMIVRRDSETLQIAQHSISLLQIGQQVNNRNQTLPPVGRLVNDPAARQGLNERDQSLKMILERALKELFHRRCQSLSQF